MKTYMITGVPFARPECDIPVPAADIVRLCGDAEVTLIKRGGAVGCYISSETSHPLDTVFANGLYIAEEKDALATTHNVRALVGREVARKVTLVDVGGEVTLPNVSVGAVGSIDFNAVCRALSAADDGAGVKIILSRADRLPAGVTYIAKQGDGPVLSSIAQAADVYKAVVAVFGTERDCRAIARAVSQNNGLYSIDIEPCSATRADILAASEKINIADWFRFLFVTGEVEGLVRLTTDGDAASLPANKDTLVRADRMTLDQTTDGVVLGFAADGRRVMLPRSAFDTHVLIVGSPGSGKGNMLFSFLYQANKFIGTPFLVIEGAKNEISHLQKVFPNLNSYDPLEFPLNPFAIPEGTTFAEYRPALHSVLSNCFSSEQPLLSLYKEALEVTAARHGWTDRTRGKPFGVNELLYDYEKVVRRANYGRAHGDVLAAGRVRLHELISTNPQTYDTTKAIPVRDLVSGRTVIHLDTLRTDEAKQQFMSILLVSLNNYFTTLPNAKETRLIVAIDEAHAVLNPVIDPSTGREYPFSGQVLNLLNELRSKGVCFVIADQSTNNIRRGIAEVCSEKIFLGGSQSSGVAEFNDYIRGDAVTYDRLFTLHAGEGIYVSTRTDGGALPHGAYFHAPNIIDRFGVRERFNARNPYLESHPELFLRPYVECSACPYRDKCRRETRAEAAAISATLDINYSAALAAALQNKDSADSARSVLDLIYRTAKKWSGGDPALMLCAIISFCRRYNRMQKPTVSVRMMVENAMKYV